MFSIYSFAMNTKKNIIWYRDNHRRLRRLLQFLSLIILIGLSTPTIAEACGGCMYAVFERIMPPVHLWIIFSIVFFLAPSIAAVIHGEDPDDIPSLLSAIAIVIGLIVIGALFIGPLGSLLLLLTCLCVSAYVILGGKSPTWSKSFAVDLKIISLAGWFTFVGLVGNSVNIRATRSDVDFILKWETTYTGQRLTKDIAGRGPESLADLRTILEKATFGPTMEIAAEAFRTFGEPETDVPLLIRALSKCSAQGDLSCKSEVETALRELSGLDLPEDTPAAIWRRNWNEI